MQLVFGHRHDTIEVLHDRLLVAEKSQPVHVSSDTMVHRSPEMNDASNEYTNIYNILKLSMASEMTSKDKLIDAFV